MKIQLLKLLVFPCFLAGQLCYSQLKFPVTNNDLRTNLSKIISDYSNQFASLKGDTIAVYPQTIEFSSRLDFKEAPQNSIVLYRSEKPVYSWQGIFLSSEDFEEASKKYKWLYNQLKVMTVKLEGGYTFTLNGEYDAPDESKKFSSSIFKLNPNAGNMPRLKIEASLQFEFPEWKVMLVVYERERDDHEQGKVDGE
jgi:hypothetical protein